MHPALLLATLEFVDRRNVADGTVQPSLVVFLDVPCNQPPRLGFIAGIRDADGLRFDALVPALDLPVGLGGVRRGSYVCHAAQTDEDLEVLATNCGPLSLMMRGLAVRSAHTSCFSFI